MLIGAGARRRSARQALDLPSDEGVNLGRLFTGRCCRNYCFSNFVDRGRQFQRRSIHSRGPARVATGAGSNRDTCCRRSGHRSVKARWQLLTHSGHFEPVGMTFPHSCHDPGSGASGLLEQFHLRKLKHFNVIYWILYWAARHIGDLDLFRFAGRLG